MKVTLSKTKANPHGKLLTLTAENPADSSVLKKLADHFEIISLRKDQDNGQVLRVDIALAPSTSTHAAAVSEGLKLAKRRGSNVGGKRHSGRRIDPEKAAKIVALRREGKGVNYIQRNVHVGKWTVYSVLEEHGVE